MSWNYRVINKNGIYGIKEVYYEDNNEIKAWSQDFMYPYGENIEELKRDFELFQRALSKPIMIEENDKLTEMEFLYRK